MKYIDTSALVKYYGSEEHEKGFAEIKKLVDEAKAGNEQLISSYFIVGEAVSVFDKWVRYKLISGKESEGIIKMSEFSISL